MADNHWKNDNGGTFHYSPTYTKGDTLSKDVDKLGTVLRVFRLVIIFAIVALLVSRIVYGNSISDTPFTDFITKFFNANWETIKFSVVNKAQETLDNIPFGFLRNMLSFVFIPSAFISDCVVALINFIVAVFNILFL